MNLKTTFIALILFAFIPKSFSQSLLEYEVKYKLIDEPFVIFNIKTTDCLNCSLIYLNFINSIKNKDKVIVLFEDQSLKYIQEKKSESLSHVKIIYDSNFSNFLNESLRNSISLINGDKITTEELTAKDISKINEFLAGETQNRQKKNKDMLADANSKRFKPASFYVYQDGFGLFDFDRQQITLYSDSGIMIRPVTYNTSFVRNIRKQLFSPAKLISDTLEQQLLTQSGFPNLAIKSIYNIDKQSISLYINSLVHNSNKTDTNLNLSLEKSLLVFSNNSSSDPFNLETYLKIYPLSTINLNKKVYYPTITHGSVVSGSKVFAFYNDFIEDSAKRVEHHLAILNFNNNSMVIEQLMALNFWDLNEKERLLINLAENDEPVITYLNSGFIEFPLDSVRFSLMDIDEEKDKNLPINSNIYDLKVNGNSVRFLTIEGANIFLNHKSKEDSQLSRKEFIGITNTHFLKFYQDSICYLTLEDKRYEIHRIHID
jgi:hypothetical protein